jgi:type IV pilus assembly protein PilM
LLGVADVGSTTTTLHVLREGQNIYTREQAFGAQHMLDDVQRRDGLTQREALERLQAASARAELRAEVLEPFQEALARQLGRALQFFYSSSTFSRVDELLLTGGASVIPGLDAAVGERLAIPIRVADPLAEVALSENLDLDLIRLHRGSMLIAVGLAMRRFH